MKKLVNHLHKPKSKTIFALAIAKIAQLVEHNLAKVGVAGSSPVFRSIGIFRWYMPRWRNW